MVSKKTMTKKGEVVHREDRFYPIHRLDLKVSIVLNPKTPETQFRALLSFQGLGLSGSYIVTETTAEEAVAKAYRRFLEDMHPKGSVEAGYL